MKCVLVVMGIVALSALCVWASIYITNREWRDIERLIEEWGKK